MPSSIRVRCPACDARIKAPIQFLGQRRKCPRCQRSLLIRTKVPDDSSPILSHEEMRAAFQS